jgi:hypothetical protein
LKKKMAELEAALQRKTEATIAAPKKEDSEAKVQRHASCQKVEVLMKVTGLCSPEEGAAG